MMKNWTKRILTHFLTFCLLVQSPYLLAEDRAGDAGTEESKENAGGSYSFNWTPTFSFSSPFDVYGLYTRGKDWLLESSPNWLNWLDSAEEQDQAVRDQEFNFSVSTNPQSCLLQNKTTKPTVGSLGQLAGFIDDKVCGKTAQAISFSDATNTEGIFNVEKYCSDVLEKVEEDLCPDAVLTEEDVKNFQASLNQDKEAKDRQKENDIDKMLNDYHIYQEVAKIQLEAKDNPEIMAILFGDNLSDKQKAEIASGLTCMPGAMEEVFKNGDNCLKDHKEKGAPKFGDLFKELDKRCGDSPEKCGLEYQGKNPLKVNSRKLLADHYKDYGIELKGRDGKVLNPWDDIDGDRFERAVGRKERNLFGPSSVALSNYIKENGNLMENYFQNVEGNPYSDANIPKFQENLVRRVSDIVGTDIYKQLARRVGLASMAIAGSSTNPFSDMFYKKMREHAETGMHQAVQSQEIHHMGGVGGDAMARVMANQHIGRAQGKMAHATNNVLGYANSIMDKTRARFELNRVVASYLKGKDSVDFSPENLKKDVNLNLVFEQLSKNPVLKLALKIDPSKMSDQEKSKVLENVLGPVAKAFADKEFSDKDYAKAVNDQINAVVLREVSNSIKTCGDIKKRQAMMCERMAKEDVPFTKGQAVAEILSLPNKKDNPFGDGPIDQAGRNKLAVLSCYMVKRDTGDDSFDCNAMTMDIFDMDFDPESLQGNPLACSNRQRDEGVKVYIGEEVSEDLHDSFVDIVTGKADSDDVTIISGVNGEDSNGGRYRKDPAAESLPPELAGRSAIIGDEAASPSYASRGKNNSSVDGGIFEYITGSESGPSALLRGSSRNLVEAGPGGRPSITEAMANEIVGKNGTATNINGSNHMFGSNITNTFATDAARKANQALDKMSKDKVSELKGNTSDPYVKGLLAQLESLKASQEQMKSDFTKMLKDKETSEKAGKSTSKIDADLLAKQKELEATYKRVADLQAQIAKSPKAQDQLGFGDQSYASNGPSIKPTPMKGFGTEKKAGRKPASQAVTGSAGGGSIVGTGGNVESSNYGGSDGSYVVTGSGSTALLKDSGESALVLSSEAINPSNIVASVSEIESRLASSNGEPVYLPTGIEGEYIMYEPEMDITTGEPLRRDGKIVYKNVVKVTKGKKGKRKLASITPKVPLVKAPEKGRDITRKFSLDAVLDDAIPEVK